MNKKNGFTLLELLVVIAIIGILVTLGVGSYNLVSQQSRDAKRISDLQNVRTALETYRAQNNSYPTNPTPLAGYINSWPSDPVVGYAYYYSGSSSDYTLCSVKEVGGGGPTPISCGACGGGNCGYKVTSRGD